MQINTVTFENYITKCTETLPVSDIIYITPEGRRCKIVTTTDEYIANEAFKALRVRLSDTCFCNCHGSYRVNMSFVTGCSRTEVRLSHKARKYRVHMSRRHYHTFRERFLSCIHSSEPIL